MSRYLPEAILTAGYLFSTAYMLNAFAMTSVLILLGLAGHNSMAAEVGIIQAATVALFNAFSANARSLILNKQSPVDSADILYIRLLLLVPLSVTAYYLSSAAMDVELLLALALIIRRAGEWVQEVHLSKDELIGNLVAARHYVFYQSGLLFLLGVWITLNLPGLMTILLIWATFPFILELKYILQRLLKIPPHLQKLSKRLIPHLGSSLIIGISVYVFRVIILLVTGKDIAGDLFTAFAIGGISGSIVANALGPSLAYKESKHGVRNFPLLAILFFFLYAILGLLIFIYAWLEMNGPLLFKSYFFFEALGLSMMGGVMMVFAQRLRFRLLHQDSEHDVFGPDVLINILLITSVPFIAYTLGKEFLVALYLLSAILCLVFYLSAKYENTVLRLISRNSKKLNSRLSVISAFLVLPVFFQPQSGIFRDKSDLYDSGGILANLPLPISVLACFIGILLLSQYRKAIQSFGVIFFTCILLTMSTLIVTADEPYLQRFKFLFLLQFLLPMFGLVLGQMYIMKKADANKIYLTGFFLVLAVMMPVQVLATIIQGKLLLTPYLGIFSIYQHLDYVPVVFTAVYVLLLPKMWTTNFRKGCLVLLGVLLTLYLSMSLSPIAPLLMLVGLIVFAWMRYKIDQDKSACILLTLVVFSYVIVGSNVDRYQAGSIQNPTSEFVSSTMNREANLMLPQQSQDYSIKNIFTSVETLFFGHSKRPARTQEMTTKNYYLDLAFNFGVLALLPIFIFLIYTIYLLKSNWKVVRLSIELVLLALVVMTLVLVDNLIQVGLRQPYPGIFMFFLWGLLTIKLQSINKKS